MTELSLNSSIDIFKSVINSLNMFNFKEIKNLEISKEYLDICGRVKLINSGKCSHALKNFSLNKQDKNYEKNKAFFFKVIQENRRMQILTMN